MTTFARSPRVLLFRNELLPSSETFILAQAIALRRFEPHFAGVHAAPQSLKLGSPPALVDRSSSTPGKILRRLFWSTAIAPAFYRELEAIAPSLLHAHFALDGAAALPIARQLHIPMIVTLHGYDVSTCDRALRTSVEGRLYLRRRAELWKDASLFLCVSQFIRDKALAAGFPAARLRVQTTGIDLDLFKPLPLERDPNLIVFVGRLVEKKGCAILLEAVDRVRRDHPAVRLVCIGAGPLLPLLQARVAEAHLPCTFVGSQPSAVVKEYLARARIFCVPSMTAATGDSEGLGMVFAEAQAMGTPVVSSQHGGIPEVVLHGRTGLLAPEGDSNALAAHLLTLLKDDPLWHRFSLAGIDWIHQAFDIRRQTRKLEDIYAELLASKQTPSHASRRS